MQVTEDELKQAVPETPLKEECFLITVQDAALLDKIIESNNLNEKIFKPFKINLSLKMSMICKGIIYEDEA